jgi:hypothetical protein
MTKSILLAFGLIAFIALLGCDEERVFGTPPSLDRPTISVTEALEPTSLNRTIIVRGTIERVCEEEGCWVVLSDGSAFLRVSFVNGSFTLPLDASGTVVVEGVVSQELLDAESARAVAWSLGASDAEIDAIDGDRRIPLMVASGVAFVDAP